MMIERNTEDFTSAVADGGFPSAPDWIAVCLVIPQLNLRCGNQPDGGKSFFCVAGKAIMESLKDGFYAKKSIGLYFGLTRGNIDDVRKTVNTALKQAVAANKTNLLWRVDVAAIGNHLPQIVFAELEWHLRRNLPRSLDAFEDNQNLAPDGNTDQLPQTQGMIVERAYKDFGDMIQHNTLPKAPDWIAVLLIIPQNYLSVTTKSLQEHDIAILGGKEIISSLNEGYYVRGGYTGYLAVTRGNMDDILQRLKKAFKAAEAAHKINELWQIDIAPIGNYPLQKVIREMDWRLAKGYRRPPDAFDRDWITPYNKAASSTLPSPGPRVGPLRVLSLLLQTLTLPLDPTRKKKPPAN